jgi:hypothetical protein
MTVTQAENDLEAPSAVIAGYLRKTISLSYLGGLAWAGRLIIAGCTAAGILVGVYMVHHLGPSYMATMRISPTPDDVGGGGLGTSSAGAGLLASLSGGAGAMQVPRFIQFLYALNSVEVAQTLDQKYDLLCRVYHGDCDLSTHQWKARTGTREWISSATSRLAGLPDPNVGPRGPIDLAQYIESQVIPTQVKKTDSVYTLTFVNRDPKFAAQFLAQVAKATNDYIRAQNREMQKRYVDYLGANAAKATNVEQRQAIDTLLLQEERQLMMTEVDTPYAARILDGPTVTPVNRALKVIAIYAALGLFLGIVVALMRDMLPQKWRRW